jgi:hypothetical protein
MYKLNEAIRLIVKAGSWRLGKQFLIQHINMKSKLLPLLFIAFYACAPNDYFQIYETKMVGKNAVDQNMIYEDSFSRITYNLWNRGGQVNFMFSNKSDKDITIDLENSFFILNGIANQYYQGRIYNYSAGISDNVTFERINPNIAASSNLGTYSQKSISVPEKRTVKIPSNSSIIISEFKLRNDRYGNCNLVKSPSKNSSINFEEMNSPLKFTNIITYLHENDTIKVAHSFYVNQISNYPAHRLFHEVDTSVCGSKLMVPYKEFYSGQPNMFYLRYSIEKD